ncbi:hypothetical protein RFI_37152 [Reticulomyxa filosa]|uniref:Uncharacterized protein n=1 Tax=Reticulomyxa filosa TaxID=46433 RepID=X6LG00_RETFI|nr:hypothetical protein RFI_37152 [Reticulomyxa filosa]|eukprot:ETO00296.1 hypothetical protein RFI_37152 [Reticulomyxa filosa]
MFSVVIYLNQNNHFLYISVSQWSRINSFGFVQGQESKNLSQPIDSMYFPHLTFQEWFAAYYLVNCLYQSNESKQHEQICSILMNEQLTPRYSVTIPSMSGILYNNITSKKDPSGSGLFPFLSSQLRTCHKSLVDSFKSWIIAWIHFDKDKDYAYYCSCVLDRPLNKVMELHLPNFQYVLHHSDIYLCIIDQIKIIQTQLNTLDAEGLIKDRLNLLAARKNCNEIE